MRAARLELQIANLRHAAGAIGRISTAVRKCMRRSRIQPVGNLHGIIKSAGCRVGSCNYDAAHSAMGGVVLRRCPAFRQGHIGGNRAVGGCDHPCVQIAPAISNRSTDAQECRAETGMAGLRQRRDCGAKVSEGFSHFVTSMTAPVASSWSGCRVGLAPTGKRRLCTAHAKTGLSGLLNA
jgi:hypothetical protein